MAAQIYARVMGQAQAHIRIHAPGAGIQPGHDTSPVKTRKKHDRITVRTPVRTKASSPVGTPAVASDGSQYAVVRETPHERVRVVVATTASGVILETLGIDTTVVTPPPQDRQRVKTGKNTSTTVAKTGKRKNATKVKTKK